MEAPLMPSQRIWNFWAPRYDNLWVQRFSLQPTRELVCRAIAGASEPGKPPVILDMGCGTGQQYGDLADRLGKTAFLYTGVDRSRAMIAAARAKYPGVNFLVGDAESFAGLPASFDMIICSHSFPYYEAPETVFARMAELLRPQGVLLLSQACVNTLYDALVMKLVSLTTSRACYRSTRRMEELGKKYFQHTTAIRISHTFYMPSLYLFRWIK
jgi:ubiquinone/menaquinone biosynthesis C-methylase UbiE